MKCTINIINTLVFVLGGLVGILTHGAFSWNNIFVLIIAAAIFHAIRVISMPRNIRTVLVKKG